MFVQCYHGYVILYDRGIYIDVLMNSMSLILSATATE